MKENVKTIKNYTPHEVVIIKNGKAYRAFPSMGSLRVDQKTISCGSIDYDIPITSTVFGKVENLPEKNEDTIYIVSSLVCQACPDRNDFFIPNESVRDEQGRIIGCSSLSRNPFLKRGKKMEIKEKVLDLISEKMKKISEECHQMASQSGEGYWLDEYYSESSILKELRKDIESLEVKDSEVRK